MKSRYFFPLGKAYGEAFCNRVEETKKLIGHINNGKHTFLVAPRRYGKSSLCEKVFEFIDHPYEKLDFHIAINEKDVERIIINGVIDLIGKSIGSVEKLVNTIKQYTKKLKPKLSIGTKEMFYLELEVVNDSSTAENIADALLLLEKLLQKKGKHATLLFDEFQEIGKITDGKGLEGAIRHVAQETSNVSFIFSGSNPHLLRMMFEDERRPLYKLCRKLVLDRIDAKDYQIHINKAATKMWQHNLSDQVFERIMTVSERHPYYVNYLCDELWSKEDNIPSIDDIDTAWMMVVEEERSDLLKDFFSLSENQRKLMVYIANCGGDDIYSNGAARKMGVHTTSISRALVTLVEKDYIEKTNDGYRLIVPVYKTLLKTQLR